MFKQITPFASTADFDIRDVIEEFDKDIDKDIDDNYEKYDSILLANIYSQNQWKLHMKGIPLPSSIKNDFKKYYDKASVQIKNASRNDQNKIITLAMKDDEGFKKFCHTLYKKYKDVYKIAGDIDDNKIANLFTNDDTTPSKDYFTNFLKFRDNAKIMFYNQHLKNWAWLDEYAYRMEFKRFKYLIKSDNLVCHEYNNKTHSLNGVEWYSLCLQEYKNGELNTDLDIGSVEIFNYIVNGYVYYFKNQKDRDNAFEFISKK